jgi:hypothetical protein
MKTRHLASAFGVLALIGAATSASASTPAPTPTYYFEHGIDCKPYYGQAGQAGYGEPGIGNFSTTAAMSVFCSPEQALPTASVGSTATNIDVYVSDNSATSPFSCYAYASSSNWGTYWGVNKFTCSQAGGCPDSTSSFTGQSTLSWTNPFPFTAGQIPPLLGTYNVGVACSIPASTTYASWIQQVKVTGSM